MANTKISQLTPNTNPNGSEEFVYAYNNANGKITLNTMKTFVGGAGITTLNSNTNIWELTDGMYETVYDLYYKSGEAVPTMTASSSFKKQMLFVVTTSEGSKGYFVFNGGSKSSSNIYRGYASYGYSNSSSEGECYQLGSRDWALKEFEPVTGATEIDALSKGVITQVINDIQGSNAITLATGNSIPYVGLTYTIYIDSVLSGQTYSVTLGTGVTNPFNKTLPTSSNKKCLIKLLVTSDTTAIITECNIAS